MELSAPFLVNIDDSYIYAKTKILFVGKETNKWWGRLQDFIDMDDSIEILKKRYKATFEGGQVISSKKETPPKEYTQEKKAGVKVHSLENINLSEIKQKT